VILIDQAAEDGLAPDRADIGEVGDWPRGHCFDRRRSLISGLMRAMIIVVPGVLSEDLQQMSPLKISI
jgi:hypothetical protein